MKRASTVLIIEDGKVLSISRRNDHNDFGIVGGGVEKNETFEQACIRETFEETGLTIVRWLTPDILMNGKTFGEFNKELFKHIGLVK